MMPALKTNWTWKAICLFLSFTLVFSQGIPMTFAAGETATQQIDSTGVSVLTPDQAQAKAEAEQAKAESTMLIPTSTESLISGDSPLTPPEEEESGIEGEIEPIEPDWIPLGPGAPFDEEGPGIEGETGPILTEVQGTETLDEEVVVSKEITLPLTAEEKVSVQAASDQLQNLLNLSEEEKKTITVNSIAAQTWNDSCVGWEAEGQNCATIVVNGYNIQLTLNGNIYEFHNGQLAPAEMAALSAIKGLAVSEEVNKASIVIESSKALPADSQGTILYDIVLSADGKRWRAQVNFSANYQVVSIAAYETLNEKVQKNLMGRFAVEFGLDENKLAALVGNGTIKMDIDYDHLMATLMIDSSRDSEGVLTQISGTSLVDPLGVSQIPNEIRYYLGVEFPDCAAGSECSGDPNYFVEFAEFVSGERYFELYYEDVFDESLNQMTTRMEYVFMYNMAYCEESDSACAQNVQYSEISFEYADLMEGTQPAISEGMIAHIDRYFYDGNSDRTDILMKEMADDRIHMTEIREVKEGGIVTTFNYVTMMSAACPPPPAICPHIPAVVILQGVVRTDADGKQLSVSSVTMNGAGGGKAIVDVKDGLEHSVEFASFQELLLKVSQIEAESGPAVQMAKVLYADLAELTGLSIEEIKPLIESLSIDEQTLSAVIKLKEGQMSIHRLIDVLGAGKMPSSITFKFKAPGMAGETYSLLSGTFIWELETVNLGIQDKRKGYVTYQDGKIQEIAWSDVTAICLPVWMEGTSSEGACIPAEIGTLGSKDVYAFTKTGVTITQTNVIHPEQIEGVITLQQFIGDETYYLKTIEEHDPVTFALSVMNTFDYGTGFKMYCIGSGDNRPCTSIPVSILQGMTRTDADGKLLSVSSVTLNDAGGGKAIVNIEDGLEHQVEFLTLQELIAKIAEVEAASEREVVRDALLKKILEQVSEANKELDILRAKLAAEKAASEAQVAAFLQEIENGKANLNDVAGKLAAFVSNPSLSLETKALLAEFLGRVETLNGGELDQMVQKYAEALQANVGRVLGKEIASWEKYLSALEAYRVSVEEAATLEDLENLQSYFPKRDVPVFLATVILLPPDPREVLNSYIAEGNRLIEQVNTEIGTLAQKEAVQKAREELIETLQLSKTDINFLELVSVEKQSWTNGCVGWPIEPGQVCTLSIVDDYNVQLKLYGNVYEFHKTTLDPNKAAAIAAMKDLKAWQGFQLSGIQIKNVEHEVGEHWYVYLLANGKEWKYEVDKDGNVTRDKTEYLREQLLSSIDERKAQVESLLEQLKADLVQQTAETQMIIAKFLATAKRWQENLEQLTGELEFYLGNDALSVQLKESIQNLVDRIKNGELDMSINGFVEDSRKFSGYTTKALILFWENFLVDLAQFRHDIEDAGSSFELETLWNGFNLDPEPMVPVAGRAPFQEEIANIYNSLMQLGQKLVEDAKAELGEIAQREEAVQKAREELTDKLQLSKTDINFLELVSAEKQTWPNGCVGWLTGPGQVCTLSFVEGYKVQLSLYGNVYEFHAGVLDPAKVAAIAAIKDLKAWQGPSLSEIKIDSASYEEVGEFWAVTLSANGKQWKYEVDRDGNVTRDKTEYLREQLLKKVLDQVTATTAELAQLRIDLANAKEAFEAKLSVILNEVALKRVTFNELVSQLSELAGNASLSDELRVSIAAYLEKAGELNNGGLNKIIEVYSSAERKLALNDLETQISGREGYLKQLEDYRVSVEAAKTAETLRMLEDNFPKLLIPTSAWMFPYDDPREVLDAQIARAEELIEAVTAEMESIRVQREQILKKIDDEIERAKEQIAALDIERAKTLEELEIRIQSIKVEISEGRGQLELSLQELSDFSDDPLLSDAAREVIQDFLNRAGEFAETGLNQAAEEYFQALRDQVQLHFQTEMAGYQAYLGFLSDRSSGSYYDRVLAAKDRAALETVEAEFPVVIYPATRPVMIPQDPREILNQWIAETAKQIETAKAEIDVQVQKIRTAVITDLVDSMGFSTELLKQWIESGLVKIRVGSSRKATLAKVLFDASLVNKPLKDNRMNLLGSLRIPEVMEYEFKGNLVELPSMSNHPMMGYEFSDKITGVHFSYPVSDSSTISSVDAEYVLGSLKRVTLNGSEGAPIKTVEYLGMDCSGEICVLSTGQLRAEVTYLNAKVGEVSRRNVVFNEGGYINLNQPISSVVSVEDWVLKEDGGETLYALNEYHYSRWASNVNLICVAGPVEGCMLPPSKPVLDAIERKDAGGNLLSRIEFFEDAFFDGEQVLKIYPPAALDGYVQVTLRDGSSHKVYYSGGVEYLFDQVRILETDLEQFTALKEALLNRIKAAEEKAGTELEAFQQSLDQASEQLALQLAEGRSVIESGRTELGKILESLTALMNDASVSPELKEAALQFIEERLNKFLNEVGLDSLLADFEAGLRNNLLSGLQKSIQVYEEFLEALEGVRAQALAAQTLDVLEELNSAFPESAPVEPVEPVQITNPSEVISQTLNEGNLLIEQMRNEIPQVLFDKDFGDAKVTIQKRKLDDGTDAVQAKIRTVGETPAELAVFDLLEYSDENGLSFETVDGKKLKFDFKDASYTVEETVFSEMYGMNLKKDSKVKLINGELVVVNENLKQPNQRLIYDPKTKSYRWVDSYTSLQSTARNFDSQGHAVSEITSRQTENGDRIYFTRMFKDGTAKDFLRIYKRGMRPISYELTASSASTESASGVLKRLTGTSGGSDIVVNMSRSGVEISAPLPIWSWQPNQLSYNHPLNG